MARESIPADTIHLRPHAPVADRVLLPGDPGRALRLAQELLEQPLMVNHNRGLWGYTGAAADGEPLTIQSTGMGGPSAAIVVEELVDLGARRLVRAGTCGALTPGRRLGDVVAVTRVLPRDGASRALGASAPLRPDVDLTERLLRGGAGGEATAVSIDLFYDPDPQRAEEWVRDGASVVEMEAATILAVAARRGVRAACVLAVSDLLHGGERRRIDAAALETAEIALGRAGVAALL